MRVVLHVGSRHCVRTVSRCEACGNRSDVIVWDWGTWSLAGANDPLTTVADLHFDLAGQKLLGRFALVRRDATDDRNQWLLIHKHDAYAVKDGIRKITSSR